MRRFKDVEHRLRLAAVFAAGLLVSGIARAELVPTGFGTLVPLGILAAVQLVRFSPRARVNLYLTAGVLALVGIFAMRWNVVIGGQLFSKSFLGYTTYKLGFATREGLLPAIMLMLLPFGILAVLLRVLPPWEQAAARAPLSERASVRRRIIVAASAAVVVTSPVCALSGEFPKAANRRYSVVQESSHSTGPAGPHKQRSISRGRIPASRSVSERLSARTSRCGSESDLG
jgi:hypothetical protein